ncbi:MAG: hypothetical protein HPY71_03865 [Firmicutes bacterium]|nr:hypothetical protein [Bacillota bacterium]
MSDVYISPLLRAWSKLTSRIVNEGRDPTPEEEQELEALRKAWNEEEERRGREERRKEKRLAKGGTWIDKDPELR